MKTISRTTMRRLLPVNVVVIALIAMSTLFVPQQSASPVGAASGTNSSASTRLFDPDMGKAARSQGNAFTKGPEGPTKTYDQEQYEIRAFPGQSIPTGGYANAAYQYNLVNDYTFPGGWRELGPRLTPNGNFFAQPAYPVQRTTVSGRATAFAVVPSSCSGGNCQIQYLGTANGGVWKTTNGGQTWQPLFDHNLQTSIGGITLDPVNPNIVYVGTGEGNNSADSNRGIGIYRSIDGGIHWTLLGATDTTDGIANVFVNRSVTRIVVDPRTAGGVNPTLYVGTTTGTLACNFTYDTCTTRPPGRPPIGFFFSKDGGQTWQMANPPDVQAAFGPGGDRVNDLLMDPSNPNVLYAAFAYYGVYRTTTDAQPASGGVGNWVRLPNQPAPGAFYRVTIDFAQSTANQVPQIMYAAYNLGFNPQTGLEDCSLITNPKCSVSGPEQIYRIAITAPQSPNGGAQFTAVPNPTACGAPGGSQCWYDMPLKIDPTNPNIVYAGGS
ncbi:MAG: exo-alpha-sialidase, partial [Chloroflexi bacterium]|nr:exo-alpha-sialidase [Chloroflexota bacterium]